ncbi:MAG: flagellar basal-body MS-ring/collar protein FliF [Pseudomonadota bacterium]
MDDFVKFIRSFGLARLGAIIGVTLGVAIAMAFIVMRIGGPQMRILYADIPYAEAQSILTRLEQDGVRHQLRDNGAKVSILVPRDAISQVRVTLAADGMTPKAGVGYEIFDQSNSLGATSFQQNINRLRALEGELARTISTIAGVRAARVHLVMPERELFARDRSLASASVVVDAVSKLDGRTVNAIINLTASAVPGLQPQQVTLLDKSGALLAAGGDPDSDTAMSGGIEDRKIAAEARIRQETQDILERIVGAGNVRVEVAADMDFSRVTESAEIIDPDSQTVLSSTTIEETANDANNNAGRSVSVANALPGGQVAAQNGPNAVSSSQRTEEITNYEITKTTRNAVREEGLVINRLSVAVALNNTGLPTPRTPEEIDRLTALVQSAIGFNAARGDQISVVDIPFVQADTAPGPAAEVTTPVDQDAMLRVAEIAALAVIAIAMIIFILRPLFSPRSLPATNAVAAPPDASALPAPEAIDGHAQIDLAQVDGNVKASSINKVSEIVKAHSEESAGILRNWMREAS